MRAGISTRVTLYSLRRSFATLHRVEGTPLKIVSAMLGHSNTAQAADMYMHADGTVTAERMQRYQETLAAAAAREARAPVN